MKYSLPEFKQFAQGHTANYSSESNLSLDPESVLRSTTFLDTQSSFSQ